MADGGGAIASATMEAIQWAQQMASSILAGGQAAYLHYSNAQQAEREAAQASTVGSQVAGDIREEGRLFKIEQRANLAARGAKITEGTPLETMERTATKIEQDARRAQQKYQWQAESLKFEASQQRTMGGFAIAQGALGFGTSLLGTAIAGSQAGWWGGSS